MLAPADAERGGIPIAEDRRMTIVFYVSGHGYGHAVRTAEVMLALLGRAPETRILVRTPAPAWLFPAGGAIEVSPVQLDVGVVQRHSLTLDPAATLAEMGAIMENAASHLSREADVLQASGAGVVVGDIPPLAFQAAARAGIPSLAITNFSWDWIYRTYLPEEPRFEPLIRAMAEGYAAATLLLRLPFHGDLSVFPRQRDIPLIARRSKRTRAEQREAMGLGRGPVALLSFGGFGLAPIPVAAIARSRPDWIFLVPWIPEGPLPANVRALEGARIRHEELVAAADVVVTKPGYGIVAECLANGPRILYTSRGDFPEYPILEEALRRHARCRFVSPTDLLAGNIGGALDALLSDESGFEILPDEAFEGAAAAADAILEIASGGELSVSGPSP
jgi:L-arabinokinase